MFNRCWQYILNLVFYLSYSLLQVKEINNVTICLQHECPGSYYGFEVVLQYVDLLSSSILYSIFLRQNELCFLCCMLNTQDSVLFTISIFKKLLNTSLIIFSCKILLFFFVDFFNTHFHFLTCQVYCCQEPCFSYLSIVSALTMTKFQE